MVRLSAFKPFGSAADALEQVNAISESQLTDELKSFLEMNLPKVITIATQLMHCTGCNCHSRVLLSESISPSATP